MATTDARAVFLDTNILVKANVASASLHEEARKAIQDLAAGDYMLWISRQILREYLTVVTRPQTFMKPLPMAVALERIRYFQSHFVVADDTGQVTEALIALLETVPVGGKQIHDANIVATMQVHGVHSLLTDNVDDFKRFTSYIRLLPLEPA